MYKTNGKLDLTEEEYAKLNHDLCGIEKYFETLLNNLSITHHISYTKEEYDLIYTVRRAYCRAFIDIKDEAYKEELKKWEAKPLDALEKLGWTNISPTRWKKEVYEISFENGQWYKARGLYNFNFDGDEILAIAEIIKTLKEEK